LAAFSVSSSFRHLIGLLGRGISPSQGRTCTQNTTQTQNKLKQASMPQVEFEPTIPACERVKTVHALDRAATLIGNLFIYNHLNDLLFCAFSKFKCRCKLRVSNFIADVSLYVILQEASQQYSN
jgi:hypothetical protein